MRSRKLPAAKNVAERLGPAAEPEGIGEARALRLARLKAAVADGTYRIAAEDIADKVIERLLNTSGKA